MKILERRKSEYQVIGEAKSAPDGIDWRMIKAVKKSDDKSQMFNDQELDVSYHYSAIAYDSMLNRPARS